MKKKFAFILMETHYDPRKHRAEFETEKQITYILTVNNMEDAVAQATACAQDGVGAIELCGAFGKEGAAKIIEATSNRVAVGYVVHNPEQDPLFDAFFTR